MSRREIWNARYSDDDYVYGTEPNFFLQSVVDQLPRGRTLCLAEGEGRNAVFLASRGHRVTALDFSSVGLEKTRRLAARYSLKVETVEADLAEYDFGVAAWDVIVSIFCHLETVVRQGVNENVVSALATGGLLVLEAYTPRQLEYGTGGPTRRDLLINLAELQSELHPLRFLIGREVDRDVKEGRLHHGKSAVVQVLATKRQYTVG